VYGPHVENFRQEAALVERGGASRRVADREGLSAALRELAVDADARGAMALAAQRAIALQKGATVLTLHALLDRCLDPCRKARLA
jgi:3-deoxy-D-manno-octulosonic-acid transferase